MSLWVDIVYPVGLHLISGCGEDHRRRKGGVVSTYTPCNGDLLSISIVGSFFKAPLLVEYLIKYSFGLANHSDHKSLLIHIIGILR